jgi:hypothetical protein
MESLPKQVGGNVVARCPACRAVTTFESRGEREHGSLVLEGDVKVGRVLYSRTIFRLLRCAGCGRGGLAEIADSGRVVDGGLKAFFPDLPALAELPSEVPAELSSDVMEAERCASVRAYRAGVALLRSVLERTLKLNGFRDADMDKDRRLSLKTRLRHALDDGLIAPTRWSQLDDGIREFANDILHDAPYQEVSTDDFSRVHTFAQRLLEDFYGDREVVVRRLVEKGRLTPS